MVTWGAGVKLAIVLCCVLIILLTKCPVWRPLSPRIRRPLFRPSKACGADSRVEAAVPCCGKSVALRVVGTAPGVVETQLGAAQWSACRFGGGRESRGVDAAVRRRSRELIVLRGRGQFALRPCWRDGWNEPVSVV